MTRSEIIVSLNSLQSKINIEQYSFGGTNIWPMIKTKLFFILFKKYSSQDNPAKSAVHARKFRSIHLLVLSAFYSLFLRLSIKKSEIIFSGYEFEEVKIKNIPKNKYYLLLEDICRKNDISFVYFNNYFKGLSYHIRNNSISIPLYLKVYRFIFKILKQFRLIKIKSEGIIERSLFLSELGLTNEELDIFLKELEMELLTLRVNIFAFKKILKKLSPSKIFELCYYNTTHYAINQVANSLGVITYDIQHGATGALHVAYANMNTTIEHKILPKYFWCWDKDSYSTVENWAQHQRFSEPLLLGNPWNIYLSSEGTLNQTNNTNKNTILLTLQFDVIDEKLLDIIYRTQTKYEWLIRFHPSMNRTKNNVINQLKAKGIKLDLEYPNKEHLPILLMQCYVHISRYSGSIIEANNLGKYSIIIDKIGKETFKSLIDDHEAFYIDDLNNLEEVIALISTKPILAQNVFDDLFKNIKVQILGHH